MCRASGVGAEIAPAAVPAISPKIVALIAKDCVPGGSRQNLETANSITDWNIKPRTLRILLTDAQTSGGLLLCVAAEASRARCIELLKNTGAAFAAIIGKIVQSASHAYQ